jgi:hypothetical protein
MSLTFGEVWPDSGVDEGSQGHPTAMMVPTTGANLVMLKGAGTDLRFTPDSHFTVKEIKSASDKAVQAAKREVPELALQSKSEDAVGLFKLMPLFGDMMVAAVPDMKVDQALTQAKAASARLLLVEGKRRGRGTLAVKSGGAEASIQVWVREPKRIQIAFHLLKDLGPDGKVRQRTTWNEAAASEWVARLNDIYTPQTNISFQLHAATWLPVKQTLPDRLALKDWTSLKIAPPAGVPLNIFLVGTWIGDGNDPLGSFIKATKDIVLDDRKSTDQFVTTLAHEFGHFLGASVNFSHPDADKKNFLMTTVDWRRGAHIPQGYAQHFNPI